jgi:hypothetical protein
MAFAFDVTSNIPRLSQSGTDTGLSGIDTAITAVAIVARSTAYTTAMLRKPPTPTGFWYRCSTAGTTAATAPTYGTTLGGTTTDGTSVWTAFKAPDVQTLGTTNHYYMPDIRVAINGTLTNANPQQQNFTCLDLIIYTGNFTSGAWASDGVTPLWDGLHFAAIRSSTSGADGNSMYLQSGGQFTFIGGEVQTGGGVSFENNTTPRSYYTRWRNTKEYGPSSARFRSSTTLAIFQNVETYDFAFDLFRMPTVAPSIKSRGSEYIYQYVGALAGGADAKFAASALENLNGTYDFDNYSGGWVELYNCAKGANLNVVSQYPNSSIWVKHCVPLYQDLRITAKDTAGNVVENVRFNTTDIPANSPTVTFTTAGGLKTWDFRNPITYETTTNASGIALSTPVLNVWYWQTSFKQNLRFPASTATYQGRAYNYKTMNVSVVLGSNSVQDLSAGMVGLDTATTITETAASAITGITLTPSGTTGGTVTISSNKSYQDVWNYYRYWISQFANDASNDTWTCTGGTLNTQNWNIVVNTGVILSDSTNITKLQTLGTITLTGTAQITGIYQDSTGTSTVLELNPPSNGYSLCIFKADGTTKYFASNVNAGSYYVYFTPSEAGTYYLAAENYGQKRTTDTLVLSGGNVWYNITDQEDVGITVTNKATVAAYTTIDNYDEFYDYTAYKRLEETYIKLGQIATRDGLNLNISAPYSVKVNQSAASVYNLASNIFTIKTNTFANGVKFTNMILVPPATLAPTTNELLTGNWEDANGDSSIDIQGALAPFSIYKFPITTPFPSGSTDDRLDPAFLIATITDRKYRFINDPAYNYFVWSASKKSGDNIPNISEGQTAFVAMTKGAYTAYCFQGAEIQLVQAPKVDLIYNDIQSVLLDTDAIKGTGFTKDVNSLTNITEAIETQGNDLTADLTIINNGVKKASIFVPHSQNLS